MECKEGQERGARRPLLPDPIFSTAPPPPRHQQLPGNRQMNPGLFDVYNPGRADARAIREQLDGGLGGIHSNAIPQQDGVEAAQGPYRAHWPSHTGGGVIAMCTNIIQNICRLFTLTLQLLD